MKDYYYNRIKSFLAEQKNKKVPDLKKCSGYFIYCIIEINRHRGNDEDMKKWIDLRTEILSFLRSGINPKFYWGYLMGLAGKRETSQGLLVALWILKDPKVYCPTLAKKVAELQKA